MTRPGIPNSVDPSLQRTPLTWPPRGLPADPDPTRWIKPPRDADQDPRDAADWSRSEPERGWLEQIERFWLGRTSETFLDRATHRGWAPDEPETYCARCGSRVGYYELGPEGEDSPTDGCGGCARKRLPWERFVRLGDYQGLLRRAVHELKFQAWRPVGRELGGLLGAAIARDLDRLGVDRSTCCLVPVATPFWRRLGRGVAHTEILANAASAVCGVPVVRALKKKMRPSQLAVAPSERRANIRGAFRAATAKPERVRVAIVLDDVRTTGATMTEACRSLKAGWNPERGSDLRVWAACVGVAQSRRERLIWTDEGEGDTGSRGDGPRSKG